MEKLIFSTTKQEHAGCGGHNPSTAALLCDLASDDPSRVVSIPLCHFLTHLLEFDRATIMSAFDQHVTRVQVIERLLAAHCQ